MKIIRENILLMGPRHNKNNPQRASGTLVLFEELIRQLDINNIRYIIIDTNKENYPSPIYAYLSIFFRFFSKLTNCSHISLHSSRDYMIFGALVVLFGNVFNKKISLRKFGGEALKTYTESGAIKQYYLKMIFFHANDLFFETKYLVSFFSNINKNTFWFPNVRNRIFEPVLPRTFQKRFVFISHVIKEKGINEIIAASKHLDSSYIIDIYGLLLHGHYTIQDFDKENVSYKGVLDADKVLKILNEYDVVLLPSYKEGYPGIIIEAYTLGIPVIATSLQGIKEIVEPYETGILVEPRSVEELVDAITYFDNDNYQNMSEKAYIKFDDFKSDLTTKQFIKILKNA